jgi:hypothetical protein
MYHCRHLVVDKSCGPGLGRGQPALEPGGLHGGADEGVQQLSAQHEEEEEQSNISELQEN